jgi:histidine triad (HIT) family protein
MSTVFSKIIAGEIPCTRVWEDSQHLAFLDVRPVRPGHTLVIPKREVSYLFDLRAEEYAALWQAVRAVEAKLKETLGCERVVLSVVGWEVPHVHVHLIPTDEIGDFPFPGACDASEEELQRISTLLGA